MPKKNLKTAFKSYAVGTQLRDPTLRAVKQYTTQNTDQYPHQSDIKHTVSVLGGKKMKKTKGGNRTVDKFIRTVTKKNTKMQKLGNEAKAMMDKLLKK